MSKLLRADSPRLSFSLLLVAMVAWCSPLAAQPSSAEADAVGYTSLRSRLGSGMPTGAGIVVEQIEASLTTDGKTYMPDSSNPGLYGKSLIDLTMGGVASWHATAVANDFYGSGGIAPGIHTVDVYEANNWAGSGFLYPQPDFGPLNLPSNAPRVINNSWIGGDSTSTNALRRVDYTINRDHTIVVAGVNNGAGTAIPALLTSSYNAIAVGLSSGDSSYGPTTLGDGPGRVKPDLVAPESKTSYATGMVSGAAADLLQVANGNSAYADAYNKPEVMKAVLMAGASKDAWSDSARTQTRPLDLRYGAGQLNVDRSYQVLTAGKQTASNNSFVQPTGWSFDAITRTGTGTDTKKYFFQVGAEQPQDLTAVLTWNRHVKMSTGSPPTFSPSLATIKLQLYNANADFSLGALVDQSMSTIDNVQEVFQRDLPAGRYALEVIRTDSLADSWDYSLAWQLLSEPQWGGGGAGNNWSEAANWGGAAPTVPQKLKFGALAAGGHANNTNDFAIGTQFNGLTFLSTAPAYNLQGNSIQLGGPAVNLSGSDQSISLDIGLVGGGGVFDTGTNDLTISGAISGAGILVKQGTGRLTLSGSNSYTGGTTVGQGILQIAAAGSLPAGGSLTIRDSGSAMHLSTASAAGGGLDTSGGYAPPPTGPSCGTAEPIPEPCTLALLATAAAVVLGWRWRVAGRRR